MDKLRKIQRELLAQGYALDAILAALGKLDHCRLAAARSLDRSTEAAEAEVLDAVQSDETRELQEKLLGRISHFRKSLYEA
jgi:hypothetical protein